LHTGVVRSSECCYTVLDIEGGDMGEGRGAKCGCLFERQWSLDRRRVGWLGQRGQDFGLASRLKACKKYLRTDKTTKMELVGVFRMLKAGGLHILCEMRRFPVEKDAEGWLLCRRTTGVLVAGYG
jgi:hypothetical protein